MCTGPTNLGPERERERERFRRYNLCTTGLTLVTWLNSFTHIHTHFYLRLAIVTIWTYTRTQGHTQTEAHRSIDQCPRRRNALRSPFVLGKDLIETTATRPPRDPIETSLIAVITPSSLHN